MIKQIEEQLLLSAAIENNINNKIEQKDDNDTYAKIINKYINTKSHKKIIAMQNIKMMVNEKDGFKKENLSILKKYAYVFDNDFKNRLLEQINDELRYDEKFYAMYGNAANTIKQLYSATKRVDELNKFANELFGGPPGKCDIERAKANNKKNGNKSAVKKKRKKRVYLSAAEYAKIEMEKLNINQP